MTTVALKKEKLPELIGIKDFRNNISSYVAQAQKGNKRFVVTVNNIPAFELRPIKKARTYSKEFIAGMLRAEDDAKHGRVYSEEYVLKKFGVKL